MSNALMRRNSSKQGLQNLMRLTAQRSIEDAEEVERERRRRARESLQRRDSGSAPREPSPDSEQHMYDRSLKPNGSSAVEEDEGFSDWTQLRERRRQQHMLMHTQGGEEDDDEEEDQMNKSAPLKTAQASISMSSQINRTKKQEEVDTAGKATVRQKNLKEELEKTEKVQVPEAQVEKRKESKLSYTSKVFLQHEPKNCYRYESSAEVTPFVSKPNRPTSRESLVGCSSSKAGEHDEAEAILETEQRLEKIRRGLQEKESQELEQLRHRQAEAEQELEELQRRRMERRRVREEEERRREEEEQHRLAKEEEEKRRMKEDIEKRRMEASERMKNLTTDGDEGFSPFSPKVPTHKITERTESLNRSLKKSNSFKKTLPLLLLSKIDDKVEQYTHAVENSQDSRAVKASPVDLPNSPEVVALKKNLFEGGEAWNLSPSKGVNSKDTDGLKVGVANLITQWVKGPSDDSGKQIQSKPADMKSGDVMQKKNMWEIIGDTSGKTTTNVQAASASKKYKFVVTGHGKYEKLSADKGSREFAHKKSDL
ncbi:non-muscle caldesmon [Gouania willdenowi]|uniref:Non-muscle caldesmon-like n=2 Tax=Gouania willdenowi TaxID=441366 RepID=A0A8C5HL53_GOUWI|nr:non-muscle caldesmon-like [Gouania willdenowi]